MRGTSFSNRLTDWPRASSYEPRLVLAVELPAQPSVVQHSSNQNFNFNWIITHPIRDLIPPEVDAPHRDLGGERDKLRHPYSMLPLKLPSSSGSRNGFQIDALQSAVAGHRKTATCWWHERRTFTKWARDVRRWHTECAEIESQIRLGCCQKGLLPRPAAKWLSIHKSQTLNAPQIDAAVCK